MKLSFILLLILYMFNPQAYQAQEKNNIDFQVTYAGGMFGFFFTGKKNISNFKDVCGCNKIRFEKFFKIMLSKQLIKFKIFSTFCYFVFSLPYIYLITSPPYLQISPL